MIFQSSACGISGVAVQMSKIEETLTHTVPYLQHAAILIRK